MYVCNGHRWKCSSYQLMSNWGTENSHVSLQYKCQKQRRCRLFFLTSSQPNHLCPCIIFSFSFLPFLYLADKILPAWIIHRSHTSLFFSISTFLYLWDFRTGGFQGYQRLLYIRGSKVGKGILNIILWVLDCHISISLGGRFFLGFDSDMDVDGLDKVNPYVLFFCLLEPVVSLRPRESWSWRERVAFYFCLE